MNQIVGASLNIVILSVFYTLLGAMLSYTMSYVFDDFDDKWRTRNPYYQLIEICLELGLFGLVAFWVSMNIKDAAPIFPVSKAMDAAVDTYVSGLFFAYAMFLFFDHLSAKIKHVYEQLVGAHVKKLLPSNGHLLEGTLSYA
jgi:hypothetical protein